MFRIYCEFTRSGSFAAWESGSLSDMTKKGWAVLLASPEGHKLQSLFARNPARTPNHYLFRIETGYLVVVTNVKPWTSGDLYTVKTAVAYFDNLKSAAAPGKAKAATVDYSTQILWSESFITSRESILDRAADLSVQIQGRDEETSDRLKQMVIASIEKSLTLPAKQRMFWGIPREEAVEKTPKQTAPSSDAETFTAQVEGETSTSTTELPVAE